MVHEKWNLLTTFRVAPFSFGVPVFVLVAFLIVNGRFAVVASDELTAEDGLPGEASLVADGDLRQQREPAYVDDGHILQSNATPDGDIPAIETVTVQGLSDEIPMSPEAVQFIKGMALMLLPETYSDDDDWGNQKRVQSGLNVKMKGLKIDTSRRWKEVNHGTWQRVDATLVDPQKHFQLAIALLPKIDRGVPRYRVTARLRLRATGRQQRWNYGARLYSVSADVVADVAFAADLQFRSDLLRTDDGNKLRVLPHLGTATARLEGFSLRSVGHAKGGAVREFGNLVEGLLQSAVKKKSQKLPTKINAKVQKKPEKFEIPAGILAMFGETPSVE